LIRPSLLVNISLYVTWRNATDFIYESKDSISQNVTLFPQDVSSHNSLTRSFFPFFLPYLQVFHPTLCFILHFILLLTIYDTEIVHRKLCLKYDVSTAVKIYVAIIYRNFKGTPNSEARQD
jgi:hypothetical protein